MGGRVREQANGTDAAHGFVLPSRFAQIVPVKQSIAERIVQNAAMALNPHLRNASPDQARTATSET